MRNFTEEERKLAVKMWKKIKNSPFRYTSYIRKKFAEKHGLRWLGDREMWRNWRRVLRIANNTYMG